MPARAYLREAVRNVYRFFSLFMLFTLSEWELTPD